ncbi:KxYKxGKxW signal peptide domain-containing protein [Lactiplantibacillus plantarum]|nr:KxYKxGKxW signal peptide domain-containing protein [Lactiplantibacillus plantarum]
MVRKKRVLENALKKNKSLNTEKATRFKLYKSGKLWI